MAASAHLKALLRKNWLLFKRNKFGSFLEIAVPIAFALVFLIFRNAKPITDVPQTSFYQTPVLPVQYMKNCKAGKNGGKVALSPPADPIILKIKSEVEAYGYQTQMFDTNEDIDTFVEDINYSIGDDRLCFGVVMDQNNVDDKYRYLIRFNTSLLPGSEDIPNTNSPRVDEVDQQDLISLQKYIKIGFLTVQLWIDNLIMAQENPSAASPSIQYTISSVTVPAHKEDDIASDLSGLCPYLVGLPLILPYLRLVSGILREKEKRIREGMKIMGLQNSAFYLAWFITYFIIMTVISIGVTIIFKVTYFVNSSFGWIFLWHWEYAICLLALGILVTVFFSRAKIGNIFAFLLVLALGWIPLIVGTDDSTITQRFWASIPPPASLGLSGDQLLNLEASQRGLTSDTVNIEFLKYNFYYHYMWMAIDIVVFLLLAAYLDQVLPSEFGVRKHPLFCLMRNKKKVNGSRIVDEEHQNDQSSLAEDTNFEETDPTLKIQDKSGESIMIKNLRKIYGNGKLAVDGVSYNMYQGQIFVLLGHNGAGKTSTISMITGLYPPTQGTTSVFGLDIRDKLEDIRKIMGVCPQHDILYDELTVKEHLELFAIFKGMNPKDIPNEVNKLISDLDLQEKRHYLSKNLSGGQKRRLSIAIAFIGGSKFIILDEPSSGMDTSSRRRLWDMLKNYKHGRVVLLTTHFMDEADYLGDRIGIMGEGKMQCLGRPLFLKNRFGVGYTLTISKKDIKDESEPIIKFVQEYIPESKVITDISSEITMQLPLETVGKFQQLFEDFDQNLNKLKVDTYGVSVTTLEQVFLNVAKLLHKDEKHITEPNSNSQIRKSPSLGDNEELDNFDLRKGRLNSSWKLFASQFGALVMKRIHYLKRDKKGILLELLIPVLMIIIGLCLIKAQFIPAVKTLVVTDNFYSESLDVRYTSILPDNSNVDQNLIKKFDSNYFNLIGVNSNTAADLDAAILTNRNDIAVTNVFNIDFQKIDTTNHKYQYYTLVDSRAQEAAPFAVNKINNAILKYDTGKNTKEIELVISPFPHDRNFENYEKVLDGLSMAFVFSIGMSLIPASLITFIVKERELTVKHQQLVSGISVRSYWFANYFVDLVKYMIPSVINCLMAQAFDARILISGENYGILWSLFSSYGCSVTAFVYLTSFLFKDYGTAQTVTFFFHFGTGFLGGLIVGMLRVFRISNHLARFLHWIIRPLPTFSLTYGLLNLANQSVYMNVEKDPYLRSPWHLDLSGGDVLYLAATTLIFSFFVFAIEFFRTKKFCTRRLPKNLDEQKHARALDQDVIDEEKRIDTTSASNYSIKVDKLRKVYNLGGNKFKVAVRQVSFGIENGDCFALLGVNGAGKTTTFKMLSGDVLPTAGRAFINGYEIPAQMDHARHDIGYCPQNDPLLENLTAREHLYLYAAIKGVPRHKRKNMVEKQLKDMNLSQYANVPAGSYSGGNKRKLAVAIAMIGNPPIVFLDEPSTGMDPEARRFMWNVISRISRERKKSSVILTTHSMEEAEALCTKMGIMVNGALRCLGTAQHIKSKYGGGYEIEIKLNLVSKEEVAENIKSLGFEKNTLLSKEQIEAVLKNFNANDLIGQISEEGSGSALFMELKRGKVAADFVLDWVLIEKKGEKLREFLKTHFDQVVQIEHFQTFYRFNISSNIGIGKVFGKIEENKEELKIMQYSVRQSTIEQIFNTFATEKPEEVQSQQIDQQDQVENNKVVTLNIENVYTGQAPGHSKRSSKSQSISRRSYENKLYKPVSEDHLEK